MTGLSWHLIGCLAALGSALAWAVLAIATVTLVDWGVRLLIG